VGGDGYYVMLFVYLAKNVITFAVETLLNVVSLVLLHRHLVHKAHLVHHAPHTTLHAMVILPKITAKPATGAGGHGNGSGSAHESRNMQHLVLVKSVTGFIHNVLLITFTLFYLNNPSSTLTLRIVQFNAYFASTVRHAINFILFYFFNSTFREQTHLVCARVNLIGTAQVQPSSTTVTKVDRNAITN
jgi:hypothetical protein